LVDRLVSQPDWSAITALQLIYLIGRHGHHERNALAKRLIQYFSIQSRQLTGKSIQTRVIQYQTNLAHFYKRRELRGIQCKFRGTSIGA